MRAMIMSLRLSVFIRAGSGKSDASTLSHSSNTSCCFMSRLSWKLVNLECDDDVVMKMGPMKVQELIV